MLHNIWRSDQSDSTPDIPGKILLPGPRKWTKVTRLSLAVGERCGLGTRLCIRCIPCAFRSEDVGVLPGLLKAVLAIQYSPVEKFKVHRCVTYAHTLLLAFCFKRASSGSTAQSLWNLCGTVSRLLQTPERCRGYLNLVYCCLREVARIKWKTTAVYIRGTAF